MRLNGIETVGSTQKRTLKQNISNRLRVRQVPEGSGEQGKMEKTGCKMMMMMYRYMPRNVVYVQCLLVSGTGVQTAREEEGPRK